LNMPTNQ